MKQSNEHDRSPRPAAPASKPTAPAPARRPHLGQAIGLAAALGCFTLALVMMGGACCLMLDWPTSLDLRSTALAVCTLAAALAFVGFGVLCLLRGRGGESFLASPPARDPVERRLDELDLTDKERQVARLILHHRSYSDIAQSCHIAPRTVQFHATNVFRKAHVARRRDFEHLMLKPGPPASTASPGADDSAAAGREPHGPEDAPVNHPASGVKHPGRPARPGAAPTTTRSRMSQRHGPGQDAAADLNLTKK